jgi:hypothetical protein
LDAFSENIRLTNNMIDPATVTVPIQNNVNTFGNKNFITGQPTEVVNQNITNATSNVSSSSVSVSAASPSIVSWPSHGLLPGASFQFGSVGSLTGISPGTTYYILQDANFTANSFDYSATFAGSPVTTGGTTSTIPIATYPQLTRLTVGSTANLVTGDWVSINGLFTGVPCNFTVQIMVVDGTHLDLETCQWGGGSYAGGGTLSTFP